MSRRVRILVCGNSGEQFQRLLAIIKLDPSLVVVGTCAAITFITDTSDVDVAVIIEPGDMGDQMDGWRLVLANAETRFCIVAGNVRPVDIVLALLIGIGGYVDVLSNGELTAAIREVAAGRVYLCDHAAQCLREGTIDC